MFRTSIIALALVLFAPVSAAEAEPTLVQVVGASVIVQAGLDDAHAGRHFDLCGHSPALPNGTPLVGVIVGDCFQPAMDVNNQSGPGGICGPVGVTILPGDGSLIAWNPDEECIENTIEWIQRAIGGDNRLRISLNPQTDK